MAVIPPELVRAIALAAGGKPAPIGVLKARLASSGRGTNFVAQLLQSIPDSDVWLASTDGISTRARVIALLLQASCENGTSVEVTAALNRGGDFIPVPNFVLVEALQELERLRTEGLSSGVEAPIVLPRVITSPLGILDISRLWSKCFEKISTMGPAERTTSLRSILEPGSIIRSATLASLDDQEAISLLAVLEGIERSTDDISGPAVREFEQLLRSALAPFVAVPTAEQFVDNIPSYSSGDAALRQLLQVCIQVSRVDRDRASYLALEGFERLISGDDDLDVLSRIGATATYFIGSIIDTIRSDENLIRQARVILSEASRRALTERDGIVELDEERFMQIQRVAQQLDLEKSMILSTRRSLKGSKERVQVIAEAKSKCGVTELPRGVAGGSVESQLGYLEYGDVAALNNDLATFFSAKVTGSDSRYRSTTFDNLSALSKQVTEFVLRDSRDLFGFSYSNGEGSAMAGLRIEVRKADNKLRLSLSDLDLDRSASVDRLNDFVDLVGVSSRYILGAGPPSVSFDLLPAPDRLGSWSSAPLVRYQVRGDANTSSPEIPCELSATGIDQIDVTEFVALAARALGFDDITSSALKNAAFSGISSSSDPNRLVGGVWRLSGAFATVEVDDEKLLRVLPENRGTWTLEFPREFCFMGTGESIAALSTLRAQLPRIKVTFEGRGFEPSNDLNARAKSFETLLQERSRTLRNFVGAQDWEVVRGQTALEIPVPKLDASIAADVQRVIDTNGASVLGRRIESQSPIRLP